MHTSVLKLNDQNTSYRCQNRPISARPCVYWSITGLRIIGKAFQREKSCYDHPPLKVLSKLAGACVSMVKSDYSLQPCQGNIHRSSRQKQLEILKKNFFPFYAHKLF